MKGLPSNVVLISRTRTDATLYELAPPRTGKKGAPRKKGDKLPKPRQLAVSSTVTWTPVKVTLYGLERALEVYSFVGLWYHVAKGRPLKFVLVRDPKDPTDWLCLFSTDTTLSVITILETMGGRWSIEVAFREAKQSLGAEHPQSRLPKAVERQFPLGLMLVSLVKLWFVTYGHQTRFAVMSCGPWNRDKLVYQGCQEDIGEVIELPAGFGEEPMEALMMAGVSHSGSVDHSCNRSPLHAKHPTSGQDDKVLKARGRKAPCKEAQDGVKTGSSGKKLMGVSFFEENVAL